MSLHVIEGTREEIKRHEAELIGHQLRLTIKPKSSKAKKAKTPAPASAFEKYAILLSSEDFIRTEQAEDELNNKLRERQKQDRIKLMPSVGSRAFHGMGQRSGSHDGCRARSRRSVLGRFSEGHQ